MDAQATYTSLEDIFQLMDERGYLDERFMPSTAVPLWKFRIQDQYDQMRYQAIIDSVIGKLPIDMLGVFKGIDQVKVQFKFDYHPDQDELKLKALYTRMSIYQRPYNFSDTAQLPLADDVYDRLYALAAEKHYNVSTLDQVQKDFARQRNRDNDYDPNHVPNDYDLDKEPDIDPDAKKNLKKLYLAPQPDIKSRAWPRFKR